MYNEYPEAIAVILTALDIELEQVMHHLKYIGEVTHPAGTIYKIGIFNGSEITWVIVVAKNGKRNVQTAVATERAIRYFEPDVIIFVGCAGGRKDCDFGDVAVAARVYDYESGAETKKGFEGADQGTTIIYNLEEKLNNLGDNWKKRMKLPKITFGAEDNLFVANKDSLVKKAKNGKLLLGTIASGEKTQKTNKSPGLKQANVASRDAVAIDTESHGFLTAARMNNHNCAFVVRGISDKMINKNSSDDKLTQPIATALAAAVAYEFIFQRIPVINLATTNTPGIAAIYRLMSIKNFSVPNPQKNTVNITPIVLDFGAYADMGFFAEEIAEKISGRTTEAIGKSALCIIATLCQKSGYIEAAWRSLFGVLAQCNNLDVCIKSHMYLVALKLLSQYGDKTSAKRVIHNYRNVIDWLKLANDHEKIASVYSRAGVAYAVIGQCEESYNCFNNANEQAIRYGNSHQQITVNVLWAIASYFRNIPFDNKNQLDFIINAQLQYLDNPISHNFAQAYPLKSAIQCLFAEASILLNGKNPEKGRICLVAASVIKRKTFAHPEAEGFAELLALIPDISTKKLLRSAMDPFEDIIKNDQLGPLYKQCSVLMELFSFGRDEWNSLRKKLDEMYL
jgi:nucleoside phosphorylase